MSVLPEEKRKIGRKKTQPTKKTRKAEPRISRRGWKRVNARRRKRRRASTWMTGWEVQFEFILCTAHPCSICPLRPMPWKLSKKARSHTIAMRKVREAEPRISRMAPARRAANKEPRRREEKTRSGGSRMCPGKMGETPERICAPSAHPHSSAASAVKRPRGLSRAEPRRRELRFWLSLRLSASICLGLLSTVLLSTMSRQRGFWLLSRVTLFFVGRFVIEAWRHPPRRTGRVATEGSRSLP
jgi:hypothetical protein